MINIFISHSWKDKAFVNKLVGRLKKENVSLWVDDKKIKGGDNLPEYIDKKIIPCILDNTPLPAIIRNRLYVDFSNFEEFEKSINLLICGLGIK